MNPILQFGTSRFLQAHVDLFVSEALAAGTALGPITVVQTTASSQSSRRVAAFNREEGFPVRILGWRDGASFVREQRITSVTRGLQASADWMEIREQVATCVQVIVSNTGDRGYELSETDHPGMLSSAVAPLSFPAKLLVLLHERFLRGAAPLSLFPCELVANNGSVLREIVLDLARQWALGKDFQRYLAKDCIWVNSLVDRIVSEPIEPVGAVAEPYALWAVEAQPGMVLPCSHPQLVVTDRLEPYERRKLFLLNLGHTFLAEQWLLERRRANETVREAMADPVLLEQLEALWEEEVMPLFVALGEEQETRAYLAQVRDRFNNPFLKHRLADIAQNHLEKKRRRFGPVVTLATELELGIEQRRLKTALGELVT